MATEPSIIVEVDGAPKTITPGADYDAVIADLRSQGRSFEIAADTETFEIEGIQPAAEGVSVGEDAGVEWISDALAQAEQQAEAEDRSVKRIAQQGLNQRPDSLLPGGAGPSSPDTFQYFEPSLARAMANASPEDLPEMEEGGKETAAYKAYADTLWKQVHDVHEMHNKPVVRVDRMGGFAGGLATVTENVTAPLMLGFDNISSFGVGRHAMSIAAEEAFASPAEAELVRSGVLLPMAERLEDISDQGVMSTVANMVGGGIGMTGVAPRALMSGGVKLSQLLGMGVPTLGAAGKGAAALAGGAAVGVAEAAGEEAVETGAEVLRDMPVTQMTGSELAMRGAMGAGGATVAAGLGKAGQAFASKLRRRTTTGGEELAQLESLTGKRGTRMGGPAYRGAESVETELNKEAAQRAAREVTGDVGVDVMRRKTAKRVGEAVNEQVENTKIAQRNEADTFYMTREGSGVKEPVDSIPAMLQAELERRQIAVSPNALSEMMGDLGRPSPMRDAPLMDNKQIRKVLDDFKGIREMTAQELDKSLRGVDEMMLRNRKELASNQFLKDLQREMRVIRDRFKGNQGTQGRSWGQVKSDQADTIDALENAKRRIGQQTEGKIDVSNDQSVTAIINSMKTMGGDKVQDAALFKVLDDMDPKLLRELKDVASSFPLLRLAGEGGTVPLYRQAVLRAAVDPSTYTRADPFADFLRSEMYKKSARGGIAAGMLPGSGSEQATAQLVDSQGGIDLMKRLGMKAAERPDEEDEDR